MKLFVQQSSKKVEAKLESLEEGEWEEIRTSGQFQFDWSQEKNVFKLVNQNQGNPKVLGMISIDDISEELRIHVNLIESSEENKGKNKIVEGVAGCLLAFVIEIAFLKGYSGFVSLVPKTELIKHYRTNYGFTQYGRLLAIEGESAYKLTQKYK